MTYMRAAELLSDVTVLDDPEMAEAHRVAISALRPQETTTKRNEPLTVDELREMPIRDWVWIDVFHSKEAVSSYYRKYDGYKKDEIFWCGYPGHRQHP